MHNLGFSDKEARVYIAFLAVGPASVQDIATKTGIQRATLYGVLESLKKKGLLRIAYQAHRKVFCAASPDVLARSIAEEKRTLDSREAILAAALPSLQALENREKGQGDRVLFGEGEQSVRSAWSDIGRRAEKVLAEVIVPSRSANEAFFAERQHVLAYSSRIHVRRVYIAHRAPLFLPRKDGDQEVRLYEETAQFPAGVEWIIGDGFLVSIVHEPFARVYWHEDPVMAAGVLGMFEVLWRAALTSSDSVPLEK